MIFEFINIFQRIKKSKTWKNHEGSIFFLFLFVLVGSFLPIWASLFIRLLTGHWINIADLWNNGGFFIYSSALSSSAVYMIHGYPKKKPVGVIGYIQTISWLLIVFSAIGFTVATILPSILSIQYEIASKPVAIISFTFIFLSLVILYYAHHYHDRAQNLEPDSKNKKIQKNIMDSLS